MLDFSSCIDHTNYYATLPYEQKAREIRAIDNLLRLYGLRTARCVESPRMMQYRVQLNANANVTKLLKMRENFCIALNDDSVNVFRDKSELVIEKRGANNKIHLGDLYSNYFKTVDGLKIMLGKDMEGKNIYTDLEKAPHMLIAGTTGSGKSVLLNVIIASLLMKNPLIEIRTVDTKRTELCGYKGIPNVRAVTEASDAVDMLSELCDVMEDRYQKLARWGCRDIKSARAAGYKLEPIVIVIDEFADLMLLSGREVEQYVVRLAQKSRAAGIHLIIGTQRPTRDVVTGLIKANIPTKICLKVTSGLDSRIILDRKGGENLLGHGDMLFLANGAFETIRIQGCMIEEREIHNISHLCAPYASRAAQSTAQSTTQRTAQSRPQWSSVTQNYFKNLFKR